MLPDTIIGDVVLVVYVICVVVGCALCDGGSVMVGCVDSAFPWGFGGIVLGVSKSLLGARPPINLVPVWGQRYRGRTYP